jgi:hypothetical protein
MAFREKVTRQSKNKDAENEHLQPSRRSVRLQHQQEQTKDANINVLDTEVCYYFALFCYDIL